MKQAYFHVAALCLMAVTIPALAFAPKNLAVLRAGDGEIDLNLRQSPAFIDEFVPGRWNAAPVATVAIPTNGTSTLFFNGHAATEGILARSADKRWLTVAGYGGVNLLQSNGTPAQLDIGRGFCTVDAAGRVNTTVYKLSIEENKLNPRGVVSDGGNNFWGCGNAGGTLNYDAATGKPVVFDNIPNTRALRIINHTLYATLNGPDATAADLLPGIFTFQDAAGSAAPLPHADKTKLLPVVTVGEPFTRIAGFDMNPEGTIAYTADTGAGIQKYVKAGGVWKLAYHFSIPQNIPDAANHLKGCFGLVADFSSSAPVIYATTTEGYNGSVNSNRVVQVVDTNATATVTTLAQSPSDKIAYRGIDFTPETSAARP